jgi:Skp family chaperone for outer membrane proteins
MKFKVSVAAMALIAAGFAIPQVQAQATGAASTAKKHRKAATPPKPSVEDEIEKLRLQLQTQIDTLKTNLADKDSQLRQAQQAAADAQAAAAKAQSAVDAQQQTFTENATAVSTLQGTVNDLKANETSLATTVSDETANVKKMVTSPDALYYKGITISPAGSFLAAETVWRQGATGGDINTQFTGVPLAHADDAQISEFYGSGRQSRLALRATGKLDNMTLTGYYEGDWLGAGISSNGNQSNSYVFRQRQLWADVKLNSGWDISGGQGWSLATETTQGLTRGTEILPSTIDSQYEAGFVWTRQYSFRVSKSIGNKFLIGAAAENAETLNPAGSGLPFNEIIGSAGNGGGLYNASANYSFNYAPDMIAKIAIEPGWGHWEVFGVGRFFRDRVYPNANSGSTSGNSVGAYNDSTVAGGIGGGFRGPLFQKKVTIGLKGLYGMGVGRYGSSTIADITLRPDGQIAPLRAFSALSTVELNPTNRLNLYLNYGGDYVFRRYYGSEGYGSPLTNMSGCNTEPIPGSAAANPYGGGGAGFDPATPSNCGNQNKDVQEFTAGYWYNLYNGPKGRLRQGIQYSWFERDLWSGNGGTTNPGGVGNGTDNMFWTSFRYYMP